MTVGLAPSAVASLCLELTAVERDHPQWSLPRPADCGFIGPVCAPDPAGSTKGRAY